MISEEEETLAWRLRQYRERAGMKQSEAAKVLGLDSTAITKIEHGERGVSAMELLALAKAYHVNVGTLLGEEKEEMMEDKIAIYTAQIEPLIKQMDAIAKEHDIPFVLVFQVSDGGHVRSAYLTPTAHKEMKQLWQWLEN